MPSAPSMPKQTNQTIMIGPKAMPTTPVPRFWIKNKPVKTTKVMGMM